MWISLLLSSPARAQFAVIDVASVAQLIQQAQTLASQLEQARGQVAQAQTLYQSLTGDRGMQLLLSGTVRNYLPANWAQLSAAMQGNGSGYGALNLDIQSALRANAGALGLSARRLTARAASPDHGDARQSRADAGSDAGGVGQ